MEYCKQFFLVMNKQHTLCAEALKNNNRMHSVAKHLVTQRGILISMKHWTSFENGPNSFLFFFSCLDKNLLCKFFGHPLSFWEAFLIF